MNAKKSYNLHDWATYCARFRQITKLNLDSARQAPATGNGYGEFLVETPAVLDDLLERLGYRLEQPDDLRALVQLALRNGKTEVTGPGAVIQAHSLELPSWELVARIAYRALEAEVRIREMKNILRGLAT